MAKKMSVELVDDLDGSVAESTVEFGLDGVSYWIDLSTGNAAELRETLAPFVGRARRQGGRKRPGSKPVKAAAAPTAADRERNEAIRQWARKKGKQIAERGRIPADIVAAYDKAHRHSRSR